MIRRIPKEIQDEVVTKVHSGEKAAALVNQYGISTKTIYD